MPSDTIEAAPVMFKTSEAMARVLAGMSARHRPSLEEALALPAEACTDAAMLAAISPASAKKVVASKLDIFWTRHSGRLHTQKMLGLKASREVWAFLDRIDGLPKPAKRADASFEAKPYEIGHTMCVPGDLSDRVKDDLEQLGFTKDGWAHLFAYMHRRFGAGPHGSDDYKDLGASWFLSTPDPDVAVQVSPSVSGPSFSIVAFVVGREKDFERGGVSKENLTLARLAVRATLCDLLRPVCVRDSHFNALGMVDDNSRLFGRWSDKLDKHVLSANFHSSSGISVPSGVVDSPSWPMAFSVGSLMSESRDNGVEFALVVEAARDTLPPRFLLESNTVQALALAIAAQHRDTAPLEWLLRARPSSLVQAMAWRLFDCLQRECGQDVRTVLDIAKADIHRVESWLEVAGINTSAMLSIGRQITEARGRCAQRLAHRDLTDTLVEAGHSAYDFPDAIFHDLLEIIDLKNWRFASTAEIASVMQPHGPVGTALAEWVLRWADGLGEMGFDTGQAAIFSLVAQHDREKTLQMIRDYRASQAKPGDNEENSEDNSQV